jgi:GNAT superfamily N-acetyltransferase
MEDVRLRPARMDEIAELDALIRASARALSRGFYGEQEIEALVRHVFGVDTTLVEDGTYFVVEVGGARAACGGWSRRATLYGGDQRRIGAHAALDPRTDAARIRAFFVAPEYARRGLGRRLLAACEAGARGAGFAALELVATLPGVPLYAACGFVALDELRDRLPDGTEVRFVHMRKELAPQPRGAS